MPEAETSGVDLRPYAAVVRRRAWLIAGVAVAAAVAAGLVELNRPDAPDLGAGATPSPMHSSPGGTAQQTIVQVLLQPPPTGSIDPDRDLDPAAEAQVVGSRAVLSAASDSLGEPVKVIKAGLGVSPGPGLSTLLISFTSEDTDPGAAATAVVEAYLSYRARLLRIDLNTVEKLLSRRLSNIREALVNEGDSIVRAALTGRFLALEEQRAELALLRGTRDQVIGGPVGSIPTPTPSPSPTALSVPAPSPSRTLLAALAIGLLLGTGLAFIREHLDGRIYEADEVRSLVPSVLGSVRFQPSSSQAGPFSEDGLRKILIAADATLGPSPYVMCVTCPSAAESSSDLALALARVATMMGSRGILSTSATHQQMVDDPDVTVVVNPDESGSIAFSDFENHVNDMKRKHSVAIVDSGSVSTGTTASSVARFVDLVAIQVRPGVTKRSELIDAVRELELAGATRVAAIVTTSD